MSDILQVITSINLRSTSTDRVLLLPVDSIANITRQYVSSAITEDVELVLMPILVKGHFALLKIDLEEYSVVIVDPDLENASRLDRSKLKAFAQRFCEQIGENADIGNQQYYL